MIILEVRELSKSYGATTVLRGVSLQVEQGEFLGIIGLSGAGKSTLLRSINRLIEPTGGEVLIPRTVFLPDTDGSRADVLKLRRHELRLLRRKVGMIFQQFNIVKRFSVIENVLSGSLGYQSSFKSCLNLFSLEDKRRALVNLKRVGLLDHAYKRADELSGGEDGVSEGKGLVPKILQGPNSTVCVSNNHRVIISLTPTMRLEDHFNVGLSLCQYVGGGSEEGYVQFVRPKSLDDSRVVRGHKGMDLHPEFPFEDLHDGLSVSSHLLGIL